MKRKYEKPTIVRLSTGITGKMGKVAVKRKVRSEIEGVPVAELVGEFGSPLFVFSERKLRERIRYARSLFESYYPRVEFSWSYKTNYLDAICAIFHQEGATAEVVSEFEYQKARRMGVPGERIIFNGPYKPMPVLEKAVVEGARINVDSFEEIGDLEEIARKLGKKIKVGIRINMDTGIRPIWYRFGFNLETGQALDAAKRIASGGLLEINGIHCHQGTFILDPTSYAREVEKMVNFAKTLEKSFGWSIEYLGIGGGFPSRSKLKGMYLSADVSVPGLGEFAEKIGHAMLSSLGAGEDLPTLVIESGRALVDEAGFLITTVHSSKRLPDGKRAYVVDAGVNILFTSFWYHFNVEIDKEIEGMYEPSVIYGPLCMNIDVIEESVMLPSLPRGTRLILSPVGAYNVTQWMQFIMYRPAVVMVCEDGSVELIRERESLEDIVSKERLPKRFKLRIT